MIESHRRLVTVMAGYAHGGELSPVTLRWIRAMRSISNALVLVFDQDDLSAPAEFADDECVCFLARRHGGYDFGSYRLGLAEAESRGWLNSASHVLLCNDSVIGPFFGLEPVVQKMIDSAAPVWGLTESYLYSPHLQSYFLLIRPEVILDPAVREFFDSVVPQLSRHDVIQAYELGFSRLIKSLGFSWKALLPAAEMFDPRNGEMMGSSTAYPICTLLEKMPVIKTRALKEDEANQDDFARTCSVLARDFPEVWAQLWQVSPHRRLWQESISVAILLHSWEYDFLDDRIGWVKQHPHPKLKCIIAVHASETKKRAQMMKQFKTDIEDGLLEILIFECIVESDQAMLQLLASSGSDWVTMSTKSLWRDFASLQLQLRRLAEQPDVDIVDGMPRLWRREVLFDFERLAEFKVDWIACTP